MKEFFYEFLLRNNVYTCRFREFDEILLRF